MKNNRSRMSDLKDISYMDTIHQCLKQQICEYELLKSMYPDHNELVLTDPKAIDELQTFLDGKSDYSPAHLDYMLNLQVLHVKLEIGITLPSLYPKEEADVYVRSNQLSRQEESNLNSELLNFIKNNHDGEVYTYTIVTWLQDHIETYLKNLEATQVENLCDEVTDDIKSSDKFVRYWIYSHHIYNKRKREEIISRAKSLGLTGFCLPGKPGVICIEGKESECNEWWRDIKSMCWKKIMVRKTETFELHEQIQQQKFKNFEELHFQNASSKNSKHADMSGFSKYMEQHNLTEAFNDFFGLCSNVINN